MQCNFSPQPVWDFTEIVSNPPPPSFGAGMFRINRPTVLPDGAIIAQHVLRSDPAPVALSANGLQVVQIVEQFPVALVRLDVMDHRRPRRSPSVGQHDLASLALVTVTGQRLTP